MDGYKLGVVETHFAELIWQPTRDSSSWCKTVRNMAPPLAAWAST